MRQGRQALVLAVLVPVMLMGACQLADDASIVGRWVRDYEGEVHVLDNWPDGTWTYSIGPTADRAVLHDEGVYTQEGGVYIQVSDGWCLDGGVPVGRYSFRVAGDTLTLTLDEDDCSPRKEVQDGGTYTRARLP